MTDTQIINQLRNGNHLERSEIERAEKIIHSLNAELKSRQKAMEEITARDKHKAQEKYCKQNMQTHFAPQRCFRCKQNIYEDAEKKGVTLKEASTKLITGCPHCNYSFVN